MPQISFLTKSGTFLKSNQFCTSLVFTQNNSLVFTVVMSTPAFL